VALRVGIGYDSHRFAAGRPLVLGGVEIPHERGLTGHSDADVLTHAVIDAILGAGGLGDLGVHFPPEDEEWHDAHSVDLLRVALGMLPGWVVNVDATVICEEPRLGQYKSEIERELAQALSAPVSVKATSNEGMGWLGRGEGIACIAVALIDTSEPGRPPPALVAE
jgi:2-C-methyl-D-erythritol 2,4-cyclodiphosphate synthase